MNANAEPEQSAARLSDKLLAGLLYFDTQTQKEDNDCAYLGLEKRGVEAGT